jgi:membrane protease YdiL (CAAX protease family)
MGSGAFYIPWYVLFVPIAEEFFFRACLFRRLRTWFSGRAEFRANVLIIFSTSLLFGSFHGAYVVPATAVGVLLGLSYLRRHSIADAVVSHSVCNLLILSTVCLTGDQSILH